MELKDTVDMMLSADWTERFKAEYYQLLNRWWNLKQYIVRNEIRETTLGSLDKKQCAILNVMNEQMVEMQGYLDAMERRAILEEIDLDPTPVTGRCRYVPEMFAGNLIPKTPKSNDKAE